MCRPGGRMNSTARTPVWRQDVNIHPSCEARTDFDEIRLFDVFDVAVSCQNKAFVLFLVRVPELSSLGVKGTRATTGQPLNLFRAIIGTYLLGSPSRLCKLNRTLCTLYTALHLSFKISKQMRPEKSTLGW